MVVGSRGSAFRPLLLSLEARAESERLLRQRLSHWLDGTEATDGEVFAISLAAAEAFANAVEHPHAPTAPMIQVHAGIIERTVTVTIRDYGSWHDQRRRKEGGYGFRLMRELMDRVGIDTSPDGTSITLERRIGGRPTGELVGRRDGG